MSNLSILAVAALSSVETMNVFLSKITPIVKNAVSHLIVQKYWEDAVQNSLLKLWTRLSDFDPSKGEITTFTYMIVRGETTAIRRKHDNQHVQFSDDAEYEVPLDEDTSISEMMSALDRLNEADRNILKASYLEKQTLESIGIQLGMTTMGACKRRQKALDALIKEIQNI